MGTLRETLTEGTEGALHLGPERPRVYSDLTSKQKEKYNADTRATNILLQGFVTAVKLNKGLRDSNYDKLYAYPKQHEAHANENKMMLDRFTQHTVDPLILMSTGNNARGVSAASNEGAQNRVGYANPGQARQIKCYNCNDEEQLLFIASGQDNVVDEDVDEQLVQDLALNVDNVFQADDCDAFDYDTMFMANLSSTYPIYDKAGPSYDSDILSEYAKDNTVPVVQSNVSYIPNDAYMMILNDMHEQPAQRVSVTTQNNVVDKL
nr:hypothetical protein [Tanacetum cinerariifolium]